MATPPGFRAPEAVGTTPDRGRQATTAVELQTNSGVMSSIGQSVIDTSKLVSYRKCVDKFQPMRDISAVDS